MKKKLLLLIFVAIAGWQLYSRDPSIKASEADVSFGYIVRISGESGSDDRLPMLIALHGNGDTAENFYETALNQVSVPARIILLKGPLPYGTGDAWPWSPEDFEKYGAGVNEAIEELSVRYSTAGDPVIVGFSGGAMMAYYQAARHGECYSSVIAVSGRLNEQQLGGAIVRSDATVLGWHGTGDSVVPIGGGKHAITMLQTAGVDAQLIEFEGGHLGIFQDVKLEITQAVERELARAATEY